MHIFIDYLNLKAVEEYFYDKTLFVRSVYNNRSRSSNVKITNFEPGNAAMQTENIHRCIYRQRRSEIRNQRVSLN